MICPVENVGKDKLTEGVKGGGMECSLALLWERVWVRGIFASIL